MPDDEAKRYLDEKKTTRYNLLLNVMSPFALIGIVHYLKSFQMDIKHSIFNTFSPVVLMRSRHGQLW